MKRTTKKMLFVQLSESFRNEFSLQNHPENLGKKITIQGKSDEYFKHFGIKELKTLTFTGEAGTPSESEKPLELQSIAEARQQKTGQAKVRGIVTAKLKNSIQIQDETGAIAVRPTSLGVNLGDVITVSGSLQEFRGLLQLDSARLEGDIESGDMPAPLELTAAQLVDHQSELATIKNIEVVSIQDGGSWANITAKDAAGHEFIIRDENNTLGLKEGKYDAITGIVSTFDKDQQIIPRDKADIVADQTVVQDVYATPGAGILKKGSKVELATTTKDATIYYTTDGSTPTTASKVYEEPIVLDKDMTIKAFAVAEDLKDSAVTTFAYTVRETELRIHHIQGAGHWSEFKGKTVEDIEGIVTYKYEIKGAHYFHMQTPEDKYDGDPKTSEGIVVYTGKEENIEVKDLVHVTGKVDEYFIDGYNDKEKQDLPVTQINARDDQGGKVKVQKHQVELPAPVKITSSTIPNKINGPEGFDSFEPKDYSMDFWESIEGMRVEVAPSRAVAPQQHGDLVVVTDEYEAENETVNGGILLTEEGPNAQTIQFKLQPNGPARDFAVKTGDKFNKAISGVVNYGFGNYKVYADLEDLKIAHEEVDPAAKGTSIVKDDDKLTIAGYNVENFSANTKSTTKQKAANIARGIVADMKSPDIVGLVEVMANDGQDSTSPNAEKSYARLIDEVKAQGGPSYEFVNIDPEFNQDGGAPGGNIRVGYLYNPERVKFVKGETGGSTDAVSYKDGKLTMNPGRISPDKFKGTRKPLAAQFEFNGETVLVINNHLNSKLGDTGEYGQKQPPVKGSEKQRHQLAQTVNNFVKEVVADNPDENIVVLGDMNDFQFTDTLKILAGDELTNLVNKVALPNRYSYVYSGNSQVLDHMLVSNHLADKAEIDMIHVNADFTDMHGRASDHDPVLAQIDLRKNESSDPDKPGTGEEGEDPDKPGTGEEEEDPDKPGTGEEGEDPDKPGTGEEGEDPDQSSDQKELEAKIKALEARIVALETENKELKQQLAALTKELKDVKAELVDAQADIEALTEKVNTCEKKVDHCETIVKTEVSVEKPTENNDSTTSTPTKAPDQSDKKSSDLPKAGMNTMLPLISGVVLIVMGLSFIWVPKKNN